MITRPRHLSYPQAPLVAEPPCALHVLPCMIVQVGMVICLSLNDVHALEHDL